MTPPQTRRRFLAALGSGVVALTGCSQVSGGRDPAPAATDGTPTRETSASPNTIYVDAADGSTGGTGARDDPVESFRHAVKLVEPGQTIYAMPGEYREWVIPPRGGEPGAPITITGPPDAVLTSDERRFQPMQIRDSHIHLTGLTIDGLWDPDNPDDPTSYAEGPLIEIKPRDDTDGYLVDIVVAPHGIGNSYAHVVTAQRTRDSEFGPFTVTGLAGANYVLTGEEDRHVGEIVYLGTPPNAYDHEDYAWNELDETRNIHVHHVDNSAGHPHSELVNTKLGTHDIMVEYCTDGGGSQNTDTFPAASVRFQSYDATLRWCDLRNGEEAGVWIDGIQHEWLAERYDEPPVDPERIGTGHAVYANRIEDFGGEPIVVRSTDPADQLICGNEMDGPVDVRRVPDVEQYATGACPADLPDGDGIGHTGGTSARAGTPSGPVPSEPSASEES